MATGRVKRVVNKGAGAGRHKPTQGGAAVVEFTLILPILLNLLFVGYVLAQGFYKNMVLANAVRTGAQFAAVNKSKDLTAIKAVVLEDALYDLPDFKPGDIVANEVKTCANGTTPDGAGVCSGTDTKQWVYVSITASYTFLPSVPYLPASIPLSQKAEMRIE